MNGQLTLERDIEASLPAWVPAGNYFELVCSSGSSVPENIDRSLYYVRQDLLETPSLLVCRFYPAKDKVIPLYMELVNLQARKSIYHFVRVGGPAA